MFNSVAGKNDKEIGEEAVSEIRGKNILEEGVSKRKTYRDSNRYLRTNLHTSIFHNNQKVKATQMSIN